MRHDPAFHRRRQGPFPAGRGGWRPAPPARPASRAGFGLALATMAGIGALAGWNASGWNAPGLPFPTLPRPAISGASSQGTVRFAFCHTGGGTNCVVDGDTVWLAGERIRIADIDAPETHPSRCAEEARLGTAATRRLQALLSSGPIALAPVDRDTDRYGRKLRILLLGGKSVGETLVEEGLARPWTGRRRPWC